MKSDYHEKKELRIERYKDRAIKAHSNGHSLINQSRDMLSVIPMGQPILVGHHSEKRDRNYRARAGAKMDKGGAELKKAEYYERRADAAESNRAISSDNPDAVDLLTEKIEKAERRQAHMKATNKLLKRKAGPDREGLHALGFSDLSIDVLLMPDYAGRIGHPSYEITNNNANINRMKKRLESLKATESMETTERELNGVRVVQNVEDNRIQLFFDGIPAPEIRQVLKSSGFRWARSIGCWQRHLNNAGIWAAQSVIGKVGQNV